MNSHRLASFSSALLTAALVMLDGEPSVGATTAACQLLREAGAEKILGGKIAGMGSDAQHGPGGSSTSICIAGGGDNGGTFGVTTFQTAAEAKATLARVARGNNPLAISEDPEVKASAAKQVVTNEAGGPTLYLPAGKENEGSGFMYAQKGNQLLVIMGMHAGNGHHRELARKLLMAVIQKT